MTKFDRYKEIDETLDEWPGDERLFACCNTLEEFIKITREAIPTEINTSTDRILYESYLNIIDKANEIRTLIATDLF